jgi:thiamine pyrophosphate-dependent acetolactate synthase large subunit-like protein
MTEFRNRETKEFYNPDFVKIAEAHGATGELVDDPKEFRSIRRKPPTSSI